LDRSAQWDNRIRHRPVLDALESPFNTNPYVFLTHSDRTAKEAELPSKERDGCKGSAPARNLFFQSH
jgi:hypothetical protein